MKPVEIAFPTGGRVHLLGTVQGLASEGERVREAFLEVQPGAVALGASVESVAALVEHLRREVPKDEEARREMEEEQAEHLSDADVGYGFALNKYGKVRLPPRCYLEAVRLARENALPVDGADFTEEQYESLFTRTMGAFALLRYGRAARRLAKDPPEAATAREFALAWDEALLAVKSYAEVERAREARMAKRARELVGLHGNVLLVVEAAREAGVMDLLRGASQAAGTTP